MTGITLFDLDNTLIDGDSDYAWCEFLINHQSSQDKNGLSSPMLHQRNREFIQAHQAGTLDMGEWLSFILGIMSAHPINKLRMLQKQFMTEVLIPMIAPATTGLVEQHRQNGNQLVLITATNDFVAQPIAHWLRIPHVLATEAQQQDGYFTGKATGTWCFREGKLTHLRSWLDQHAFNLDNSYAYSDSYNDLPLLAAVTTAVAVNPDPRLHAHARKQQWQIVSLREGPNIRELDA